MKNQSIEQKYQIVKEAIRNGSKVIEALRANDLGHGNYYEYRSKDPDPVKKLSRYWSRKPRKKNKPGPKTEPKILTVPLTSKAPKLEEKIVAIVCQPSQLKTILEGLNDE